MDFVMDIIQEFFVKPIETYSGYNPVNTLVYAGVMLLVAFGVLYPLLNRQGIKFNHRFALALLPYILFGISFRLLEEMGLLPRSANPFDFWYYTISPGIWVLVGVLTLVSLFLSRALAKRYKIDYLKLFAVIGAIMALPFFAFNLLYFKEPIGFLAVILGTAAVTLIVSRLLKGLFEGWKNKLNKVALSAQALDGMATFIAIEFFNCGEQHFLPRFLISFSTYLFPLVKILLVILILHYVDKSVKDENLKGFVKLIVIILGFSTGLRDLVTLGLGTCGTLF